jgi:hypothetical protein
MIQQNPFRHCLGTAAGLCAASLLSVSDAVAREPKPHEALPFTLERPEVAGLAIIVVILLTMKVVLFVRRRRGR